MNRSYHYSLERRGKADPAKAFELLRDAEAWAQWAGSPITYSAWKSEPLDGHVVGSVRLVGTPRFQNAERITVDEAPRRHGYEILARWPVRDYSALVHLTPGPDGELTVRWTGSFTERIPGTGLLWRAYLRRLLGRLAERLIVHAAG